MFLVIGGLSMMSHHYTLGNIKSRTVGDGQHGTARWATDKEIRQAYAHVPFKVREWRRGQNLPTEQGLILGCKGQPQELTALVDSDDIHCLMIGASGIGKTAFFLYPNLEYACASGMSWLALDSKGDLARNYGTIAKNCYGYNVSVIDLRNPTRSDGNNLLTLVNRYMDIARKDPKNLAARAKAEKYAKILAKTIVNPDGDDSNRGQNAFFLALFFATIQYMFMLGTRTQFAILLLIVILAALQFAYSEQGIAGVLKCIGIMAVISLIAFLLYHFNVLSIRDYILSTNLAARYERRASLENADSFRFQSFWIGLRELIQYPMGGRASQIYRHNMWLDVGRVSGIIPFCLLLVYSIKNFANVTVIWKNTKILPSLRYLLLFLYIGAYVNCFVEPIWEGALNFFLALCVVDGMVSAMMRRLENDPTPEESVSDTSNLHTDL